MKKKHLFAPTVFKLIASLVAVMIFYWLITYVASSCGPETIYSLGSQAIVTDTISLSPTPTPSVSYTVIMPCGAISGLLGRLLQIPFFIYLTSLLLGYLSGCIIGYYFEQPKKAKKK